MQLSCPECQAPCEYEPVTVITPETAAHDQLLRGELNRVQCPECETAILCDTPVLFRDDVQKQLIYYIPAQDCPDIHTACEQMQRIVDEVFAEVHPQEQHDCRLVTAYTEFIEKIGILNAGYNDLLIEYVKYRLFQHNPGISFAEHELLYDFASDAPDTIVFQVFEREAHKHVYTLQVERQDYLDVEQNYLTNEDAHDELHDIFPPYRIHVDEIFAKLEG